MKEKKHIGQYRTVKVLIVLSVAFAMLQGIRPSLDTPVASSEFSGPEKISVIFKKSCYDCHSNQTRLSWFDYLQPVYSKVVGDIKNGRAGLNFSAWGVMGKDEQKGKLFEILNQIELGSMPTGEYLFMHHEARISAAELKILRNYVSGLIDNRPSSADLIKNAEMQFKNWVPKRPVANGSPKTLTGIPYYPDYRDWEVINITDRLDNNSLRIIFGNPVAVKAVRENQTNPWPQGAVLAKVMWDRVLDSSGIVLTGSFKQVEFMVKDKKYSSTAGWGWARFKTMALIPYGKNTGYATECVNCHIPLKGSDYVFTKPIKF